MTRKKSRFMLLPLFRALTLLALVPESYALSQNFEIGPNGPLPTTVASGQTVNAYFNVTNLTKTARNGYEVRGFPPSTMVQTTGPGYCSKPINLAAKATCVLQLTIKGEVHGKFGICKGNSCTTSAVPLDVSVGGLMVAGGLYCAVNSTCYPLLAESLTGSPWTYPSTILSNLPTDPTYLDPAFYSASCAGQTCIAVGEDSSDSSYLLVAMTTDNGNTWTYPIGGVGTFPLDMDTPFAGFNAGSCSNSICIAAGAYEGDTDWALTPVVAQYTGGAWSYAIDSTNPPADIAYFGGYFSGASCTGSTCIAVGAYEEGYNVGILPLIALTYNNGASWIYPVQLFTGPLPYDYDGIAEFYSASCNGSTCIAGGDYEGTGGNEFPLVYQSTDGGANWTIVADSTGPLPLNYSYDGFYNGVSCSANICVAGGTYYDGSDVEYPLLIQSVGGGSWAVAIDSTSLPANFTGNGEFNAVSCSGNVCAAAGYYNDSTGQRALLAQTTDGGTTWTYVIDDTVGPQLPDYNSDASFRTVSCGNNNCIAAGSYQTTLNTYPMLAQSIGGGAWTYAIDNNGATLPSNYMDNGTFDGSSISVSSLKKRYEKHGGKKHFVSHAKKAKKGIKEK